MTCPDALVVGIDLAASERRCSGVALLCSSSRRVESVGCARSDEEIVSMASAARVAAIDAPLAERPSMREVDRKMISLGFRVLPPSFGAMRALTERGWRLREILSSLGVEVIETHPRSALRSSGARDVEELAAMLRLSLPPLAPLSRDERDAIVAAAVALCRLEGCYYTIEASDGVIYLIR